MKVRGPFRNSEGSTSYSPTLPLRAQPGRGTAFVSANRRVLGWAALFLGAAMMAIGAAAMVLSGP